MEDWENSLLTDRGGDYTDRDWQEAQNEEIEEAREYLREYYDDISWAKGKEKRIMVSVQHSDSELALEWIRKGWMWYDADEDEWMYSSQGRKARQERLAKTGFAGMPDTIII